MMIASDTEHITTDELIEHARGAIQRLRVAMASVIHAANLGLNPATARLTDIGRAMGIDKKLAWKVQTLLQAEDPFEAVQNMPGRSGMEIFLSAAARVGATADAMERVREAYAAYNALARIHAADRAAFEAMLSRYGGVAGQKASLEARKIAFKTNAYLFGAQAAAQFRADFAYPASSGAPYMMDFASVRGLLDLVRTDSSVRWPISRLVYRRDDDSVQRPARCEPIDEPVVVQGGERLPLLRDFCTKPLPLLETGRTLDGAAQPVLVGGVIGNTGAATVVTGEIARESAPSRRDEDNEYDGIAVHCSTPCEFLQCDYFVHRDLFGRIEPEVGVYSELHGPALNRELLSGTRLAIGARVAYLGRGVDAAAGSPIPRYAALVEHVCARLGWDPGLFDVYRVSVEFPIVPSCVFMTHRLPERSGGR